MVWSLAHTSLGRAVRIVPVCGFAALQGDRRFESPLVHQIPNKTKAISNPEKIPVWAIPSAGHLLDSEIAKARGEYEALSPNLETPDQCLMFRFARVYGGIKRLRGEATLVLLPD